ncbi:MAG: ribonucleotide-diphosphate reductase [Bacillus thermozeamaize]|uniref:Ribonucleoside-diphosphate reductase n=1 Tax=Bacillus thermozeamaize TaxID=230954 RepID=A0A1Y3PFC1_9BACI|nr:MAG: ribonucleotide-diphosphate reductase [Bacillus thermozeamaize]
MASRHIELNNEMMLMKDGFYQLEKDQEAVDEFMREVEKNMLPFDSVMEKVRYMVEHGYYYNVFADYSEAQVKEVFETAYSYNFKFKSYMAASKFYQDYALKTNDKAHYLERYEDRVSIVALFLGRGDREQAMRLVRAMMEQRYQPATPTFMNAGRKRRGEMVSCFLLEMDDTLNSIGFNINTSMQLSKIGGGVALNLSKLRARGEPIKEIEGAASGVIPVAKLLEDAFSYADQLGQRKGAGAAYLNIFHWDIVDFLDTKKINADEKIRLKSLAIGVIVPSKFFELAAKNEPYYVFAPYSVYRAYGQHLDDMDMNEMYDELIRNEQVKKKRLDAREMLTKIAVTQMQSGYPYLVFIDNANAVHALKDIGRIKMSNLCTEIFQLQETSEINDYDEKDNIRRDVSCILGSLNIVNVMESGKIRDSVHVGIEALTAVSDMTRISNAPSVKKANQELHAVGLGAMNLHGYFAKNKIQYESEEAKDFVRTFFMMMNYYSLEKSCEIARVRGETFKDFNKSEYAKGTYFKPYLEEDFSPRTEKVKQLFAGIDIPTPDDWRRLKEDVQRYGLYNAYRLAIAPTQSISYIQNATSSVMPVVDIVETRTYANSTTYYPMPYLSPENRWYYKSAFDMDQYKLIDLIAEIQRHVDQGVSTVLYVNSNTSTRELVRLYAYAHHKGLKSLYYTRNRLIDVSECTACAV